MAHAIPRDMHFICTLVVSPDVQPASFGVGLHTVFPAAPCTIYCVARDNVSRGSLNRFVWLFISFRVVLYTDSGGCLYRFLGLRRFLCLLYIVGAGLR